MDKLLDGLYSGKKEKVNEIINEIRKVSERSGNKEPVHDLFDKILANYDKNDNENIKITIRALNAALYFGIPIKYIKEYKEILLNNITNEDGKVRRLINSVMDSFRLIFLPGVAELMGPGIYDKEEHKKLDELNIDSYVELTKKFESTKNEKIRSSILSAIRRFHTPAFNELISKTNYKDLYEKFSQPSKPEEIFISLSRLLKEDTPEIKNLKSLYYKEEEYSDFLGMIEYMIAAFYYYENRNVTDKKIKVILKDIKKNYEKDFDFFQHKLEKNMMWELSQSLQVEPMTHHELNLVFDYILWSIDNRNWMQDKQAYVKWQAFSKDFYNKEERKRYEESIRRLTRRLGLSKEEEDIILLRNEDYEIDEEKQETGKIGSEFFSMDNQEKIDFLLENGTYYPSLIRDFLEELVESDDFDTIKRFHKRFVEKHPTFIPIYLFMSEAYFEKNKHLAKYYIDTGLKELYNLEDIPQDLFNKLESELQDAKTNLEDNGQTFY